MADEPLPLPESSSQRRWLVAGALLLVALLAIGLIVALVAQDRTEAPSTAEWAEAFAVESVVILDARTAIDEAAARSKGAASVRCEAIQEDPAIEAAIDSITDAPDDPIEQQAAAWAALFREGAEFCVAGDLDEADARFDRADELLLLLGEKADVEVDIRRYERRAAFDDLTGGEFGFTDEQANCILDRIEAQGLTELVVDREVDDVDPADIEAVTDIFGSCVMGDLFSERPDDTIDETG